MKTHALPVLLLVAFGIEFLAIQAPAQVYEKVFSFADARAADLAQKKNAGGSPRAVLVQGTDGNLYGTTAMGGAYDLGTVFKLTPAGQLTTLVEFNANAADQRGAWPVAGLVQGRDGNFYGTTQLGSGNADGTVFRVTPGGILTTIVGFTGNGPVNKGSQPEAALVEGPDGAFYGTTVRGGAADAGTVFRVTPGGVLTTLVEFTGDGATGRGRQPQASLLLAGDGNFYGTTVAGGANDAGTVFKMTPGGSLTTLVEFTGNGPDRKGREPFGGLIQTDDGNFYGTTRSGGEHDLGTVFRMTPGGAITTLVEFAGDAPGYAPWSGLVRGSDGFLYGTTAGSDGSIYRMAPDGSLTTLVAFPSYWAGGGREPLAGLMQASDGNFYGTTSVGGARYLSGSFGLGTVFKMTPSGVLTTLVEFAGTGTSSIGSDLDAGLVEDGGNFYGTTAGGGAHNEGTVFKLTPGGTLTTLAEFTRYGPVNDGSAPSARLVKAGDGNFYGTTTSGGAHRYAGSGLGTVFKITPGGALTTLLEFSGIEPGNRGHQPQAGLVEGADGSLYGTTGAYSTYDLGTVFKLTPEGVFTTLVEFTGNGPANKGSHPRTDMIRASDGNFYGTTNGGGADGCGTIFKLTPDGILTTLVEFTGNGAANKGKGPAGGLIQGTDGNFYGATGGGGAHGRGTVFKMEPAGALTTLVEFTGGNGSYPAGGLVQAADGNFYGTTSNAGQVILPRGGTIFKMTPAGVLTTLHSFDADPVDFSPREGMIAATDGNLYGTTIGIGGGAVFRLIFPGPPNIYPLAAEAQSTNALITSRINARGATTTAVIEYGTVTEDLRFSVPISPSPLGGYRTTFAGTTLEGLTAGTTYYFRIRATSSEGTTLSPVQSFSTLAEPLVTAVEAGDIAATSVRLHGTVNARNFAANVVFEWGTDGNSFPNPVPAVPGTVMGNTLAGVSAPVAGLTKGTAYYYRVRAINPGGVAVSGTQSFTTLTEPLAGVTGAAALSTTRARIDGWVNAMGAVTAVTVEYGTDGVSFNSVPAVPGTVNGADDTPVSAELQNLTQGTSYYYRIKGKSPGGEGYSPVRTFTLSILSGLTQSFPDPPSQANGSVRVDLTPAGVGGWRFAGEQQWRAPGATALALASGDRIIEFQPVAGFNQPPQEVVSVVSGGSPLVVARDYFASPVEGRGGLSVTLKPDALAAQARWRLSGAATWRVSGETLTALNPGTYLVECQPVPGRTTPPAAAVVVVDGQTALLTRIYFQADAETGSAPEVLDFQTVSTNEDLPYAFAGQLRSNAGSGTGFVVKRRVVATAAHMVWDDGTLSAATGLQWLFQRDAGTYEPRPQIPRGFYMSGGYAAQRQTDNSPGTSSPESQHLDYAVLYFTEEAGRGGVGGFLASDAATNEFLDSPARKLLLGYPVDGILPADRQGRMHATVPANIGFTRVPGQFAPDTPFRTYTTTHIRSSGGNSGGPLCVQHANGKYYPAAIYLGGSSQTVVRAIDSAVVDLITRAEVSANGGSNNTGGGITHTSVTAFGTTDQPGAITVIIEPAAARSAGAGWRLAPETAFRDSSSRRGSLSAGTYTLEFRPLAGFQVPTAQTALITGGLLRSVTYTYAAILSPLEMWRQAHFGSTATNTGPAADYADPDGDGQSNIEEYAAATNPQSSADRLQILTVLRSGSAFTVTTAGKAGRRYELQRTANARTGPWTVIANGTLRSADGTETLTDPAAPAPPVFYRVRVSVP